MEDETGKSSKKNTSSVGNWRSRERYKSSRPYPGNVSFFLLFAFPLPLLLAVSKRKRVSKQSARIEIGSKQRGRQKNNVRRETRSTAMTWDSGTHVLTLLVITSVIQSVSVCLLLSLSLPAFFQHLVYLVLLFLYIFISFPTDVFSGEFCFRFHFTDCCLWYANIQSPLVTNFTFDFCSPLFPRWRKTKIMET